MKRSTPETIAEKLPGLNDLGMRVVQRFAGPFIPNDTNIMSGRLFTTVVQPLGELEDGDLIIMTKKCFQSMPDWEDKLSGGPVAVIKNCKFLEALNALKCLSCGKMFYKEKTIGNTLCGDCVIKLTSKRAKVAS